MRSGPAGRLAAAFVDSKLTPLLVTVALALGVLAVILTPREEEPQIVVPMVDVMVGMPGASPLEVESRITLPLERRLWAVPGVEYVYSTSMLEKSLLTVRFEVGEDLERSLVKVYEKLIRGLDAVPPGATVPLVRSRSIDDVPILALTLSSPEAPERWDSDSLRRLAGELRRRLSALDDVARVEIIGGHPRALRLELDPEALAASGLGPTQVADRLMVGNRAVVAGAVSRANQEVLIEGGALFETPEEVGERILGVKPSASGPRPIALDQVASVLEGPTDTDNLVMTRRGAAHPEGISPLYPAVTLTLAKRKGADAYKVANRVLQAVEQARGILIPDEIEVAITRNYGETANEKAMELLRHLVLAIVSVSILIGLALGWRGALVVFISVPVSFALTLFVYYTFGYTLNRVTLFALIFVTGIVVDDSIIVVENIVRHVARARAKGVAMQGSAVRDVAVAAVQEVGNPTILATLTVIVAVLPMAFVRGLMGPYMEPMPTGASLAMGFSLLVALVVTPWFAYRILVREREPDAAVAATDEGTRGADADHEIGSESRLYRLYERLLVPLLVHRRRSFMMLALVVAALLVSVAMVPLGLVNVKMLPFDNKSEFQVIVDMPEGTTLATTHAVGTDLAEVLVASPEVTDVQIYSGVAAPIGFSGLVRHYDLRRGAHVADLQVNLSHKSRRSAQSHTIARRLRAPLQEVASKHGAAIKVLEVPPGPPVLSTVVAEIYGPSQEERLVTAEGVLSIFARAADVVDVDWTPEAEQRKLSYAVDPQKAALAGVPEARVARALRLAVAGEKVGLLHREAAEEPVPVELRVPRSARSSPERLGALRLASEGGSLVPVSELTTLEERPRERSRHRKNLRPVVYVLSDVAGESESPVYAILEMSREIEKEFGGSVTQHYRAEPENTDRPALKWDGEWQITYEVFRDLGAAFGLVLVLIYVLLIGWFRSFRTPLVMMVAIPLGLVGVLPGHFVFGAFFTATSMIGFIALAGIMVRNSVLLIDFVHLSEAGGMTLGEAVVAAGATRLRPILLTAGTVVVGAVVILFDPIFQGLAIALMFGALASTALTLLVVPVLHFLVESRSHRQPLPHRWLGE